MKGHVRVLAIDDGSFTFHASRAVVAGVVMRLPSYTEAVMVSDAEVDGTDSTDTVMAMLARSRYLDQLRLIMLDGVALGGFNVVDVKRVHEETGIPVATITRDEPDFRAMEAALRKHFEDWRARMDTIRAVPLEEFDTGHTPIWVGRMGIGEQDLKEVLRASIVKGALPEPLRVAHLIATAISRGESRGRA